MKQANDRLESELATLKDVQSKQDKVRQENVDLSR